MNASLSSNNYIYYESDNGSGQFVYINSYDRRNLYTISDVNGVTTLNIYSKLFNKLPISNQNGTDVTVKTSNITSDTTQYIKIKQEEESYTIKNIYTV
jgi:hypothetical protein